LPMPKFHTKGAVGFDVCARTDVEIPAGTAGKIPLNVAIEPPKNCWAILAARSSTYKFGLMPVNGIGIFDSDYCGDGDEYLFLVYNFTKEPVRIKKGERVAQIIIMKRQNFQITEAKKLKGKDRRGLGTTGKN